MTRLTSSLTFYCRNCKKDKQGLSPIEASIIISGQRTFINLPRKESPAEFKRQTTTKKTTDIKQYLDEVRTLFNHYHWTGYTKEQIYKEEQDKTTEFYNELCQEYGLK